MKKTKKGFTVVELIIVIAVIAVLTAILVPTFIHLTKKANEAADHSLVTNLNKALAMREAEEGDKGKNNTMYDCVMDLEKEGYKLPQLATRSEEDLVWSLKENRFFLSSDYNEVDHGGKYDCWHIYEKMPETEEWGIYPNEDKWTETEVTVHKVGFDAGKAAVTKVTFDDDNNGVDAVIRTTGGTLNIANDGTNGKVRHYGSLDKANVTTDNNCFYTHGKIKNLDIAKGKAIASQDGIIFLTTAASGTTVTKESNGLVISLSGGNIDSGATVDESTNSEIGSVLFTGGDGSEANPFIISNRDNFQNVSNLYEKGYFYYKVKEGLESIDCKNWTPVNINGSLNGSGTNLTNIDDRLFLNIGAMGTKNVLSSWSTTPVTIENYKASFMLEGNLDAAGGMAKQILGNNVTTLRNIEIYGQIVSGSNSGALFSYTTGNPGGNIEGLSQQILINDCFIYAKLVSTSSSVAVVSGFPNYNNPNLVLKINNPDTIWQGTASNPKGVIKFVTMSAWTMPEGNTPNRDISCTKLSQVALTKESDGSYHVGITANASVVKAYIGAQLDATDSTGADIPGSNGITMAVQYLGEFDLNETTKVLDRFNVFEYHNKASKTSATVSNNKLTVNIGGTENYTKGSIKLVITESDLNGNILSYQQAVIVSRTSSSSEWTIK